MKTLSLFSGIGGICKAFENYGFEIVFANEIDKYACETYKINLPNINLIEKDIREINPKDVPDFDILIAGFPCQSFSLAGNREGLKDFRGNLFFNIIQFLKEKKPKIVFLENVKNLLKIHDGDDFKIISNELESIGYLLKHKIMSPHEYANIPQNRERIFIVGFLEQESFNKFYFSDKMKLTTSIDDIIDRSILQQEKYYYTNKSQYYQMFVDNIKNTNIFQLRRIYIRENKSQICPTLTANMGGGGHNVPIIKDDFGIRKLTPLECSKFQGFDNLKWICSDTHIYKQIGNSVCVKLIEKIAENIKKAI